MTLQRYQAFYHVARSGSFSRAAEQIYVSQPALSHAVKKLEEEVGCALLLRHARGVALTAEGQILYDHLTQAYRWIEDGERQVRDMKRLAGGEVRIGASEALCRHYLLPYLARFHRDYPGIHLHVTNGTSRETMGLLHRGFIDFGLVNLPLPEDGDARVRVEPGPLLYDCFVVSPDKRGWKRGAVSLAEVAEEPLILLEPGSVTRDYIDGVFRNQGIALRPEIELGSLDLVVDFARQGLGVGVAVRNFIESDLRAHTLYEVMIEPPLPPRRMGLIRHPDEAPSLAVAAFLEGLRTTWTKDYP